MQNDLQDKCGVIGIYSPDENVEVAPWILSGLHTIQHRGQESAGISVIKNGIVKIVGKKEQKEQPEESLGGVSR